MNPEPFPDPETENADIVASKKSDPLICPVCGSVVVSEKCKLVCRSEICRGRIVMNCSEF